MAPKAEQAVLLDDDRLAFLRDILGIVFALAALLMLLSLASARQDAAWIGPLGEWLAANLDFVFGHIVAFVLPTLMLLTAVHMLRGQSPLRLLGGGWIRGLGGTLILLSACALLTLYSNVHVPGNAEAAFEQGGVIGNMLIDRSGLALAERMGSVGASVVFGGLATIGLVLFTRTLLRDLLSAMWAAAQWLWERFGRLGWLASARSFVVETLFAPIGAAWRRLCGLRPWVAMREFIARIEFGRADTARVIAGAPLELEDQREPRRMPFGGRRAEEEDTSGRHRTSSILGGARMRRALDGQAGDDAPATSLPLPADAHARAQREAARREAMARVAEHELTRAEATQIRDSAALEDPIAEPAPPRQPLAPAGQAEMELFPAEYRLPGPELLADPPETQYYMSDAERDALSRKIEQTLAQFKVEVEVIDVVQGPTITRFALRVAPGIRVNKILQLDSEMAMALKAPHIRILAPIPGQSAVGVEVPNKRPNLVVFKELLLSDEFAGSHSPLTFALGKNIAGETVVCDLAKMPHLLIAGATGAGKSVCLNTIIASLLYRNKPDRVKFVMVDPKRVELSIYQAIPHLLAPVVAEAKKAAAALAWCVEQMEQRYQLLSELAVRNIDGYNAIVNDKQPNRKAFGRDLKYMPHIVIVIDELADLMMVAKNEVEEYIIRLAQMARAVGIHLILATQRPSVNVITGIIKANFPSRIAFQTGSKVDSRTILDANGAETLLGRGDMLYSPGGAKPFRIQGAFISDAEVERLADKIREQEKARYVKEDFEIKPTAAERAKANRDFDGDLDGDPDEDAALERAGEGRGTGRNLEGLAVRGRVSEAPLLPADVETMTDEDLYAIALKLVLEERKASVSYIQRRLKIGYSRAGRLMDIMEERGIVGPYQGSKPRDIIVDPMEYLAGEE